VPGLPSDADARNWPEADTLLKVLLSRRGVRFWCYDVNAIRLRSIVLSIEAALHGAK
jgi:hypothetical protein